MISGAAGDGARLLHRAAMFEAFAERVCVEDPLYVALCRLIARRDPMLALLDAAPAAQRRPNLLLAAIHDRLLEGCGHALGRYFPTLAGDQRPDDGLASALDDFFLHERSALHARVASHSTQTNEIGRCAVLWPALCAIAAGSPGRPLALLDFGCSAGLNLGVDHYAYEDGRLRWGALSGPGTPSIHCRVMRGTPVPRSSQPRRVADRLGLDPAAVDVHDDAAVRWLRACIWPHDDVRVRRYDQAVRIARVNAWPVRREADCAAAVEPWLDGLPTDRCTVVFNSWVLDYMEPQPRARHIQFMRELVQRRGIHWLSAERTTVDVGATTIPAPEPGDAEIPDAEIADGMLWQLTSCASAGVLDVQVIARSHPHGRWMAWYGLRR